jgi:hypothetical protein
MIDESVVTESGILWGEYNDAVDRAVNSGKPLPKPPPVQPCQLNEKPLGIWRVELRLSNPPLPNQCGDEYRLAVNCR